VVQLPVDKILTPDLAEGLSIRKFIQFGASTALRTKGPKAPPTSVLVDLARLGVVRATDRWVLS